MHLDIPAGQYRIPYTLRKGDTNASSFDMMEDSVHPAPRMVEVLASQFTLSFSPPAVTATAGVVGPVMTLIIRRLDSSEGIVISEGLLDALRETFKYEDVVFIPAKPLILIRKGLLERELIFAGNNSLWWICCTD